MSSLVALAKKVQQQAIIDNFRQMIHLQGDNAWCFQQAELLIEQLQATFFWLGEAPSSISAVTYKNILGQECELLIINAHSEFDANMFAASEGCLKGGGLLLLLSPAQVAKNDLFYCYVHNQLALFNFIKVKQNQPIPELPLVTLQTHKHNLNLTQQSLAVEAIIKTATGHRRRPLVLTANRGRGKSAALGIASAYLLENGYSTILVCAPNKQATTTLFKHAQTTNGKTVQFIAPDALIAETPICDLLIIDEAAAIPVAMLETLVRHYSRVVFATTQHGYEGSGRGFALRFQKRLDTIAPQWREMHLDLPIRWASNDPVEQFTLNSLCLTESPDAPFYNNHSAVQFELIDKKQLLDNKPLLQSIFSLLVIAHYQTKPSDLEKLLNDASLSVFTLRQNEQLLAVALINKEGNIDPLISNQIWQGKRRLQGNLIAQSITFHCGFKEASTLDYARIQRIAVYPELQNQGLGKRFVGLLKEWADNQQFDFICASFGATADLLNFWQQLSFNSIRLGLSQDSSSGTHSMIVGLPLSSAAEQLQIQLQQQLQQQLPTLLSRHLQQVDSLLILTLLNEFKKITVDTTQLQNYADNNLPYEFIEFQLINFLANSELHQLSRQQQKLVIGKVLQNNSWAETVKKLKFSGKKEAQKALKHTIKQLLKKEENHAPR